MLQDSQLYINRQLIAKIADEKILQSYNDVTLQDEKMKIIQLRMEVTTHRILLFSTGDNAFLIQGSKIHEVLISESGMLWSKEYFLKLRTDYGKIKFQMKNYKEAQVTVSAMIKNKAWTRQPSIVQANQPQMYSGVFNKIQKEKQKIDINANKVGSSFTSFESLFGNLREIKQAMKQMRAISGDSQGESSQVNQILKDIGFVSAISKQQAGRDYMKQLAKDLYGICSNTLFKKYGGIVSLLDLFYFYNMKRQTQLVSPQELLEACQQFGKFGYSAKLVSYPNNIKMVESTLFDEKQDFDQQFQQFFKDFNKGYSAQEISRKKGLPLSIVQIKLKKACRRGVIAIDSRIQGVKYYRNLLLTI